MRVLRKLFCAALVLGALSGCVTTDGSAPTRSAASEAEYAKQMELGRAHLRERRRPEAFEAFLAAAEAKPGDKEAITACTVLARFENKTEVWLDSLSRQLSQADEVGKSQIYGAQVTAL
jgi:Flp pilus assembly protein TadD